MKPLSSLLFGLAFILIGATAKAGKLSPIIFSSQTILTDTVPKLEEDENKRFERVETEAAFPGGEKAWREFLERNLESDIPTKKKAPAGTYTVVVQFIVDREGNIADIKALTNHGFGMEEEVVRVIKKSSKWTSAMQNGRTVKAYRKQPVTFQVEEKKKKKNKNKED